MHKSKACVSIVRDKVRPVAGRPLVSQVTSQATCPSVMTSGLCGRASAMPIPKQMPAPRILRKVHRPSGIPNMRTR